MPNVFRPASLLIETDLESSAVDENVLLHPAGHNPAASRVVLHETLHYWQQLSQPFPARLAAEDLARLERFEDDGAIAGPGPCRREYVRRYQPFGFSALDLQEALARCWDVHILGPARLLRLESEAPERSWSAEIEGKYEDLERRDGLDVDAPYSGDAYDLAMEAAAGRYGKPYLALLDHMPSIAAASAFPLLAHLAMHARRPVPFYLRLLQYASILIDPGAEPGRNILDRWRASFDRAHLIALELARVVDETFEMMPLLTVEEDKHFARSAPHHWARHRLNVAVDGLAKQEAVRERAARLQKKPVLVAGRELMLRLATPGIPEHRAFLAGQLSPPIVKFADGERRLLGEVHRRMVIKKVDKQERRLSKELVRIADEASALDQRWQDFVRAGLRKGFAAEAPAPPEYESAIYDGARAIANLGMQRDPTLIIWLMQLLDPEIEDRGPLTARGGWVRFVSAMLTAHPVRAQDIDHVSEMLIIQLALRGPLNEYQAATGLTWEWSGSPHEAVLAAELCAVAAQVLLDDVGRAKRCFAIELEALKFEAIAKVMEISPEAKRLTPALVARVERLHCRSTDDRVRTEVRDAMARVAAEMGRAPNAEAPQVEQPPSGMNRE